MSSVIISKLKSIVGQGNYFESKDDLTCYRYDATFLTGKSPLIALYPTDVHQISEIMKIADAEGLCVIPRGAGTGLAGGYVPIKENTIILHTSKLNKIIEIDKENLTATVEAGVVTEEFQAEVDKLGLFYPPDPSSGKVSTIGGNVATNAGGPRGAKYGNTLAYVLGLEVVLADGRVINTGSKCVKQSSGYNLTKLFVSSEGTLGIITKIILRLIPLPESKKTMLAVFNSIEDASQSVSKIIAKGIIPTSLELMNRRAMEIVDQYKSIGFPLDAEAVLVIEVDGVEKLLGSQIEIIRQVCEEMGVRSIEIARDEQHAADIWEARKSCYGVLSRVKPSCLIEDVTVPRTRFPEIIRKIEETTKKYNIDVAVCAHAGDGNTHPFIITDARDKEEMERVHKAMEEIVLEGLRLGGTLSGEHGIGVIKKK
ncbi:MAG: FAD-linked oxidase C-terminal domain-containing protein, partial [Bacillota bacterium]|nr:FAD-linked oxidase C-terminal domain-containing protein [Bacillota bacterium]